MIFTENPEINPNLTVDDLPGTFAGALRASAESALYNSPVWQFQRTYEDKFKAGGPLLDYETARSRSRAAGVDIRVDPNGMTEGALNLLIERKRFQARTHDAIARGPQGFVAGAAYFLSGLGAAMLDPINLASAFIPVARGLGMAEDIARAGLAGEAGAAVTATGRSIARARVGAVEGAVGQATLEPLTAFRASQEQEDYGITDTLLNVGFGAALGAVAHTGLGALGDRAVAAERGRKAGDLINAAKTAPEVFAKDSAAAKLRAADMETNAAVFRSEIAAAADGRKMDSSVLVAEQPVKFTPETVEDASGSAIPGMTSTFDNGRGGTGVINLGIKDGRLFPTWVENGIYAGENRSTGGAVTAMYEAAIREARNLGLEFTSDSSVTSDAARIYDALAKRGYEVVKNPNARLEGRIEIDYPRWVTDDGAPVYTVKPLVESPQQSSVDPVKVQQVAAASHLPENDVHYDAQAKAEVDAAAARKVEVDPTEEVLRATQEAQTELATLSQQLGLDPEKNAAVRGAEDMATAASRYSKAIEAFASCQVRS